MTLHLFTAHHTLGHTWGSVHWQWPCLQSNVTVTGSQVREQGMSQRSNPSGHREERSATDKYALKYVSRV